MGIHNTPRDPGVSQEQHDAEVAAQMQAYMKPLTEGKMGQQPAIDASQAKLISSYEDEMYNGGMRARQQDAANAARQKADELEAQIEAQNISGYESAADTTWPHGSYGGRDKPLAETRMDVHR